MAIKDVLENKDKEGGDEPSKAYEPPKIFLFLASLMVVIAVLAYVFEDRLFEINYSSSSFIFALIVPIFLALFFLYCYRSKKLVGIILGRPQEIGRLKEKSSGVSFDVFSSGNSAVEEKQMQSRRKKTRHTRKQYAKATKSLITNKEDVFPKSEGKDG